MDGSIQTEAVATTIIISFDPSHQLPACFAPFPAPPLLQQKRVTRSPTNIYQRQRRTKTTMGISVTERVKKYRAKKRSTEKGREAMRALNRIYKARSRLKKRVKRLSDERDILKTALHIHEVQAVVDSIIEFQNHIEDANEGKSPLNEDEQLVVKAEILKYEIKAMKAMEKQRLALLYQTNKIMETFPTLEAESIFSPSIQDLSDQFMPLIGSWDSL